MVNRRRRPTPPDLTGLYVSDPWPALDRLATVIAELLEAPIVLVSVLDDHRQVFKGQHGLPPPFDLTRETAEVSALCREVAVTQRPVIVQDARHRRGGAVQPWLGCVGYAGVPILDDHGECLAILAAADRGRRAWVDRDLIVLRGFAPAVLAIIDGYRAARRQATLEQQLARERAASSVLLALAGLAGAGPTELAAGLAAGIDALGKHLGWPCLDLVRLDHGQLRSVAWYAADPAHEPFHAVEAWPLTGDPLALEALRTRRPVAMHDLAHQSGFHRARLAGELGLTTGCATVVTGGGEPRGLIALFGPTHHPELAEAFELVPRAAALIGELLERAAVS